MPKHPLDIRLRAYRSKEKAKKREVTPTLALREQRELAWLLYVTEGYIASVVTAVAVNSFTLDNRALSVMQNALKDAEKTSASIRAAMQRIKQR